MLIRKRRTQSVWPIPLASFSFWRASSTAVIAYLCGSMSERVKHKTAGFLATDEATAVTALRHLAAIDSVADASRENASLIVA